MKILGHVFVVLQLLGIAGTCMAFFQAAEGKLWYHLVTMAGIAVGVATLYYNRPGNFSVHPEPRQEAVLITQGPYRWVRHPMYLSVILVLLGLALHAGSLVGWSSMALATGAMLAKSVIEEQYLSTKFPNYKAYQARTKRVIPLLW